MNYQIDNATLRNGAPLMSAYPKHTRAFTEPISATQDVVIGPGKTMPELIRLFYPSAVPEGFRANFGFLDRDNKERIYEPGKTDPFVFRSMKSLTQFREHAHELMAILVRQWEALGLPVVMDKDRGVNVPDGHVAWLALSPDHEFHQIVKDNRNAVYFILANADIVKKACVVRTINAGWWAVSYGGKNAPNKAYFKTSLSAHKRAVTAILDSAQGRALYDKLWNSASDPLDTNPGYPFFTAQVDTNGQPVTRIKTVELFRNLGQFAQGDWGKVLTEVDHRAGQFGLAGHPFAVPPIRRLQPGYKWAHQFTTTPAGLITAFDERGVNSQRVAHMVPYAYNVITAPLSTAYKVARMLLPGTYHDGPAKIGRMATLKKMDSEGKLWLAEADYKNFDRFMAVDLIEEIVGWFTDLSGSPSYWNPAMMYLHKDASLIWPDFSSVTDGIGWVFKPGSLGLLSGVKATSDTGTLVNSVVNGEALARTMEWTEDQLFDYLMYHMSPNRKAPYEYYYVQSDDTQLIQTDPELLKKHGDEFMKAVTAAGLVGSIELADRFLMRHIQAGRDAPVPARVWQNTLSNESPPESEIVFLAGLASRTDGLLGVKTVDAFATGKIRAITKQELEFTQAVLRSIRSFMNSATLVSPTGLKLIDSLLAAGDTTNHSTFTADGSVLISSSDIRNHIIKLLAQSQLEANLAKPNAALKWIQQLLKDKNIPSSAAILAELVSQSSEIRKVISSITAKDEAFFKYASHTMAVTKLAAFSSH